MDDLVIKSRLLDKESKLLHSSEESLQSELRDLWLKKSRFEAEDELTKRRQVYQQNLKTESERWKESLKTIEKQLIEVAR